ncbi:MAG: fumarylacetoacetate hydrolase family protein [Acidobacteriota bacterium]
MMGFRLANISGRAALVQGDLAFDLSSASGGLHGTCLMAAVAAHRELPKVSLDGAEPLGKLSDLTAGPPVPSPSKAFGIGLNYRAHAEESGMDLPEAPLVFAKYPNCISGPHDDVPLRGDACDYEAELVVVIGDECKDVAEADAWDVVAGVTAGQDISDRRMQFAAKPPQFGLGKSFDGFGPIGPVLVSPDELADRHAVPIACDVNGDTRQSSDSSDLIFSVPELIAYLSRVTKLLPGDLIFTGTPSGVGSASKRYLKAGDVIETRVEGVGTLRNLCTEG